ncbi:MAG: sulfotransferase [Armatimonadota bacterium]
MRPVEKQQDLRTVVHTTWEKFAFRYGIRSRAKLHLPDFLGIGAQKAGTTWLDRNMRAHPDLFLTSPKELHYFDLHFHESLKEYSRKLRPGLGKVRGEITPGYSTLTRSRVRFIRALMPDLRLLFLMRNPVDRAWSQAMMTLVSKPGRPFESVKEAELLEFFRSPACRLRGNYLRTLRIWESTFPKDQLYVGFYEDIKQRPQELLREVFRHVGVREEVDWDSMPYREVIHRGAGIPMPPRIREALGALYAPEIERLYQRFGDRVAGWRVRTPAGR